MNGASSTPAAAAKQTNGEPQDGTANAEVELPLFELSQVSLALLVHRTSADIFKDLLTLAEILPSMPDMRRKYTILEFAGHAGRKLLRLAVLARFSGHSAVLQKCTNLSGFFTLQNEQFEYVSKHLESTLQDLANARIRNYDLPNALDLLTIGKYTRLPAVLKTYALPQQTPENEIKEILQQLDRVLQLRLAVHDHVPWNMRKYTISNGKVVFRVGNLFKATMTVAGAQHSDRWYILGVDFSNGKQAELPPTQHEQIVNAGNRILSDDEVDGEVPLPERIKKLPSLCRIYSFLHGLASRYRLERLYLQAMQMSRRVKWSGNLAVTQARDRQSFTIHYWTDVQPTKAQSTSKLPLDQIPSIHKPRIVFSIEDGCEPSGAQNLADLVSDAPEMEAILNSQLTATQYADGDEKAASVTISDDEISVDTLLQHFLTAHIQNLMKAVYHQLTPSALAPNLIKMQHLQTEPRYLCALEIMLLPAFAIKLAISIESGQFLLTTTTSKGNSADRRIRQTSKLLNEYRDAMADSIMRLRTTLIVDTLESKMAYLGLQPYRRPPLSAKALARFGNGQPCFVHMPKHPLHYFVVVCAESRLKFALVALQSAAIDTPNVLEISEMGWLDLDRLGVSSDVQISPSDLQSLYEYTIVRITSYRVEQQLYARRLPYAHTSLSSPVTDTAIFHPSIRLRASDISKRFAAVSYRNILVQIVFKSRSRPCQLIFSAKLNEQGRKTVEQTEDTVYSIDDEGILTFKTHELSNCVESFFEVLANFV